jgi:hypothetical protein
MRRARISEERNWLALQEKQNFSSAKIISVGSRKRRQKLSNFRRSETADGSYGDNFRRLGKLTEVRSLNHITCTRPCPLSDLSPPPPHHPTPTARPSAPPRRCLLYSRCLPELLHAPAVLSPRRAAARAFHSLSRTWASHARCRRLVGAHGQPRHRLCPGCLPAHRLPAGARPLHRFLGHQP